MELGEDVVMKKIYTQPEIEVVFFTLKSTEIITTSSDFGYEETEDEGF